jgi:hypothetical protein
LKILQKKSKQKQQIFIETFRKIKDKQQNMQYVKQLDNGGN